MAEINSSDIGFEKEIWKAADKLEGGRQDARQHRRIGI